MMGTLDEVEDAEANHFAISLLLPKDMVRQEVRAMGGVDIADDADVKMLARKFGVSISLMAFRIGQLSK